MPLKPKLAQLKKVVAKLAADTPPKWQGAGGWPAVWRLDDLCLLVADNLYPEVGQRHRRDVALMAVARLEAARLGRQHDPEVVSALSALEDAVGRCLNPPRGTGWAEHERLYAVAADAHAALAEWVLSAWAAGGMPGPRVYTVPPSGRPPRLQHLPAEWSPPAAPPAGEDATPPPS